MLAPNISAQYTKSHVLIVRAINSEYAQRRQATATRGTSEESMHPSAPGALALRTAAVTYPGTTEHIRAVRADLRPLLDGCPIADEVILCASELAANAALHSNSRLPGGTFTIRAEICPGWYAHIEVEDTGGPWTPAITDQSGHHGLDIVRALATVCGIHGDHTRRTAWATFDWPSNP